jgi:hypothetical protein
MSMYAPSPWHKSWLSQSLRSTSLPAKPRARYTDTYRPQNTWTENQHIIKAKVKHGLEVDADNKKAHNTWIKDFLGAKDVDGTVGFNPGRKYPTYDQERWDPLGCTKDGREYVCRPIKWKAETEGLLQRLANELEWHKLDAQKREQMRVQTRDYLEGLKQLETRLMEEIRPPGAPARLPADAGRAKTKYGERIHTQKVRDEVALYQKDRAVFQSQGYAFVGAKPDRKAGEAFYASYDKDPSDTVNQMDMEEQVRLFRQYMFGAEMRARGADYQTRMNRLYDMLRAKIVGDFFDTDGRCITRFAGKDTKHAQGEMVEKQVVYRKLPIYTVKGEKVGVLDLEQFRPQAVVDAWDRMKAAKVRAGQAKQVMLDRMDNYRKTMEQLDHELENDDECGFIKDGEKIIQTIKRRTDGVVIKKGLKMVGPPIFQSYENRRIHAQRLKDNTAAMYGYQRQVEGKLKAYIDDMENDDEAACCGSGSRVEGYPERLIVERKIATVYTDATPARKFEHKSRVNARKDLMVSQTRSHLQKIQDLKNLPFEEHMARERAKWDVELEKGLPAAALG